MNDVFSDLIKDGVGVRVHTSVDPTSAFWLGAALFIALVAALTIYARVLR